MRRYFTYSFLIHVAILVVLVIVTYALPSKRERTLRFVVLPKGTSLDAALTPELEAERVRGESLAPAEQETAAVPPAEATPRPTPEPTLSATPTPNVSPTATPVATPPPTPEPEKTIVVTPKPTKPSPTGRPSPNATAKPQRSPSPTAGPNKTKPAQRVASQSPTRVASAYAAGARGGAPLAGQRTPVGLTPRAARPSEEVGIPGVPEGVEGAPLPLDREQSLLSMLYATRARMKIQSNFTVPPDVNDPNITCVVDWEILPDGTIRNIRVVKSTGVARLDACAVDALKKTANLGPLPPEWGTRSVWTSLTFVFAGDLPGAAPAAPEEPVSADPRRR